MRPSRALCMTPACLELAAEFKNNLAANFTAIDPCTDFEEMVCGGWRDRNPLPAGQGQLSTITIMSDRGYTTLRDILEGPYPAGSNHSHFSPRNLARAAVSVDQLNFDTMQRAYNACMDTAARSEAGFAPALAFVQDLRSTFAPEGDLSAPLLYLARFGMRALVSMGVTSMPKDPEMVLPGVGPRAPSGLGAGRYYNDTEVVAEYVAAMAAVLEAVYAGYGHNATQLAGDVVRFETRLTAIQPTLAQREDPAAMDSIVPLRNVTDLLPQLGADKIIAALAPPTYRADKISVPSTQYLANLSTLLSDTPRDTVQAFLLWSAVVAVQGAVTADVLAPYKRLLNRLNGASTAPEQWKTCMNYINSGLGWILSRFFIEGAFSARSRDMGNDIIAGIKHVYNDQFDGLAWMDDAVKALAKDKVNRMSQKIGYPSSYPNITDPPSLRSYYAGTAISASHFANSLAIYNSSAAQDWAGLGRPINRAEWHMTAATVNAYYSPNLNEIVFPAAIMQLPLFHADLPSAVNYGSFGAIAGHEISHGFDNTGRLFDARGVYGDWWTPATSAEFEARVGCLVDQVGNMTLTVPGAANGTVVKVNGRQTVGEAIADSAGLTAAFAAWTRQRATHGDDGGGGEPALPGLEGLFTDEQLFFVAFGNLWCTKTTLAALQRQVLVDSHPPGPARILGATMNSRAFREAFKCRVREPACELWS
ncbi:endothelin-converting enzyme [Lasiosphaeris hirsuta]|uniref:Endothelin-converting enzyme n=1 Tax=Lasiosphaeris hirsuta TaxID=260670 RepID=A0AA40DKR2_9PEZI|nr:endothelin-converting enzyme [Lasiosphaeris hirsuta]